MCGLFQTGYLVSKMNHIDIRKEEAEIGTTMLFVCSDGKRDLHFSRRCFKMWLHILLYVLCIGGAIVFPLLVMYAGQE